MNRRPGLRFHRVDPVADQPGGGGPADLLTKQQLAVFNQPGAHFAGFLLGGRGGIAAQIVQPAALLIERVDKKQPPLTEMAVNHQAILGAKRRQQLRRSLGRVNDA